METSTVETVTLECKLEKSVFQIAKHADLDPARYCLDCVYWDAGRWVVTDGRALVLISGSGLPEVDAPIMLDAHDMLDVFKRLKKRDVIASIVVHSDRVTFAGSGISYDVKIKTEGSFPKYKDVIPMGKKRSHVLSFDAGRLAKVMSFFPNMQKDTPEATLVEFDDSKARVSCTVDGMTRTAVLMGVTT